MRRLTWLVVLAVVGSAFAITAQESKEQPDLPPALGAPIGDNANPPAEANVNASDDPFANDPAVLPRRPIAAPNAEFDAAPPGVGVDNQNLDAAELDGPQRQEAGGRLPPPRLPVGELAPPARDLLPEPAVDAPRTEGVREVEAESASDRPLTNLDLPVADSNPPVADAAGSAHRPQLPGQPHSYPLPRRDEQAREAIQRRAEFKAAQRARRMETMKWFGYSNSRPTASSVPFMGTYSPTWVGNGYLPSHWSGVNGWSSSVRVETTAR